MGTTAEKLQKLMQTKDDIKTAINDPALGDKFADYPTAMTVTSHGGIIKKEYISVEAGGANIIGICSKYFLNTVGTLLNDSYKFIPSI